MTAPQNTYSPAYEQYQPRKIAPADKKDILFLLLTLASLFLIVDFGLAAGMNLGFTIAYAALFATATAYLFVRGCLRLFPTLCGILSLVLCPVFALYNDPLNFFAFFAICLLFSIYIGGCAGVLYRGTRGFRLIYDCFRIVLVYPFAHIVSPFEGIKAAGSEGKKRSSLPGVILGLLACIPVLCIVIPLLISSDAAFEGLIELLFKRIGITLLHLFVALILTPFLFGVFYGLRHSLTRPPYSGISPRRIDNAIVCGFLGLLSAVYLVYLFSQLAYFFSAFGSVLPEAYTAADYARRGFFELCAISVINLFLMFCAFTLVKKPDPAADIPRSAKGFGIFLCLFDLVLVGTAISKMALYIDRFGLTRMRILTTVFMVMMGVLFLCLILRLISRSFPYMAVSLIICTLIGGGVLYADIDTVTAGYNADAYLTGRLDSIDFSMLEKLGAPAAPALDRLAREAESASVKNHALALLCDLGRYTDRAEDFRYFNYCDVRAEKIAERADVSGDLFYSADPRVIFGLSSDLCKLFSDGDDGGVLCASSGAYRYEILLDSITAYQGTSNYTALRRADGSCYIFYAKGNRISSPMSETELESEWQRLTNGGLHWYEID